MQEIAMTILDIVQNSIRAGAHLIHIWIVNSQKENKIHIEVRDDGCGMNHDTLQKVIDPFYTTRTTRSIGLGIPMFKESVEMTGGYFFIDSKENKGTTIIGEYVKNHIDTPPMGDLVETVVSLLQYDEHIDYCFRYQEDDREFVLDTKEIKELLEDVPINQPEIILWLKDYIKEGMWKWSH